MQDSRLEAEVGVMPRSPKGRAAARGLDARLSLQHAFMPAGDASLKTAQLIKMLVDSNHGIYRERDCLLHRMSSPCGPSRHSGRRSTSVAFGAKRTLPDFLADADSRRQEIKVGEAEPSLAQPRRPERAGPFSGWEPVARCPHGR